MLSVLAAENHRTCSGLSRREFLRVGGLGMAGLQLADLLAAQGAAATGSYLRNRSVVFLFLSGGPSHIEFFDPKMSAPSEFRSITDETPTRIPGVTLGGTFEKLAARTDQFSIVRSFQSKNGGHTYGGVASGNNPIKAAVSSIYARVAGVNNPRTGMPNNVLIKPEAIEEMKLGRNFETNALPTLTDAGSLGKTYAAFDSSGGGPLKENMELRITLDRLDNRRLLLQQIDGARRQADSSTSFARLDKYQQQAFEMIARGISDAFDISQEDPRTLARYDSRHTFRAADLQRYGDMRRTTNLLGHQLLLARRLCEAGCGFVTVSDCGWDMHANGNSPKGMTGMWPMSRQVDHAVAAFLDDLRERGMSDEILLVVTGEMGRTPRINKNGGRDHWGDLTALLLAGGGVPGGRVVGQSDAQAARPASDPYNPTHLAATIYQSLFEVGRMRLDASLPREVTQIVTGGKPILQA